MALTTEMYIPLHRGAFCQFTFQWIYYYGSNKSTGKETGKTHLCALAGTSQSLVMWKGLHIIGFKSKTFFIVQYLNVQIYPDLSRF